MRKLVFLLALVWPMWMAAQQYTAMSGLIHVPSADMHPTGEARLGGHFLNKEFTPDGLTFEDAKYHTASMYLSLTPFSFLELGYTFTLLKDVNEDLQKPDANVDREVGYYRKDRHLSVKLRVLKEDKWWPSVAVGSDDIINTVVEFSTESQYFRNYYVTMTKHLDVKGHIFGAHVAYRKFSDTNQKWNGVVGGLTYQPSFQQNLRLIAEYTGNEVNVGADWRLWNHVLLQVSLLNGKYFSGGVCFCLNLL